MPGMRVRRRGGSRQDSGYMLLVLMLAVAILTITMLQVATNYRRSIQRDREVEMIHRGVQYERAVQLYYRKFGAYPTSIEQLENTNKIRFLRKRYKDPMSPDGQWQIAHLTDIPLLSGVAGLTATTGSAGTTAANQPQASTSILGSTGTTSGNAGVQTTGTSASGPADATGTATNGAGPVLGGGPMLGVISKSTAEGIHSFNGKSKYNEWYFIYVPSQDRPGLQLSGPFNPNLALGATATSNGTAGGQTGSPAGTTNTAAPAAATPTTTAPPSTTP